MQQVAQLAQMLSSQSESAAPPPAPAPAPAAEAPAPQIPSGIPDLSSLSSLSSLLGGIDMNTISRFLPLLQELNSPQNSERAQLLYALKPFLRPERRDKIDNALRLARLFHVGKTFFKGLGDGHV